MHIFIFTDVNGGWSTANMCINGVHNLVCTNPAPVGNGEYCTGDATQSCDTKPGNYVLHWWTFCENNNIYWTFQLLHITVSLILQNTLLLKVAEAATELLQRKNARRPLRYWACLTLQQKWGHGLDRPTAIGGLGGLASGSTQTLPLTMIVPQGSSASVVPEVVSLF